MTYPLRKRCKNGHRYTGENTRTVIGRTLYRRCVKCSQQAVRRCRAKKAVA